ncbi:hypothetical protein TWF191_000068 [Orbilia oligospora]|uniref:WSC domain-containing protein n=1 Tax=Orbilia oligospora TaxID=2813651 RepID=A0A7C8R1M7_ORBOL|nr:hypothetical protein TWF191_000068 [Orbilia oligospora]
MRFAQILKATALALVASSKLSNALASTDEIQDCDASQSGYLDNHNLSPDIVNDPGFGILWQISTIGGANELFFAKPLVYTPPSTGIQVIIAASAMNWVYVIDAKNGTVYTKRQLGKPFAQKDVGCGDVQPFIGIMGTPVIDPATDTIYLFSKSYLDTSDNGATGVLNGRYRVYALDVLTLADKFGFPLMVEGSQADNDPQKYFMGGTHMQRPSLAMINGIVWAGVASHCDQYNYTGWIFGIDPSTPRVVSLFSTISGAYSIPQSTVGGYQRDDGGGGAGIWQAGMGLASDRSDRFFVVTSNGHAHEDKDQARDGRNPPGTLEECIVSLKIDAQTKKLKAQDFFQPYEYLNLDNADKDFGSSGFTLLDPNTFSASGVTRMGVTGGKNGKIYLVNADNLGGYKTGSGGGDSVLQTLTPAGGSIFGGIGSYPKEGGYIYASSPGYNTLVYSFGKDSSGKPVFTQVGMTAETNAGRVGTGIPTVTSMNGRAGTGILWLTDVDNGLRAWNAIPNADGTMTRLNLPPVTFVGKWQRPAFGDGKLYIAGSNGKITCLGAPINLPLTCTDLDFGDLVIGNTKTLNVKCQANIAITSFKGLSIVPGLYFKTSNSSVTGISLAKGQNVTIPVTLDLTTVGQKFTPGSITSSLQIMTNNGVAGYSSQQPVGLAGSIVSSAAFLQLQPLEISFGGVVWGSEQQIDGILSSMYIKNIGTQPMTILNYVYTKDNVDDINNSTEWIRITPPATPGDLWYLNDGFEADFPAEGSTIAPGTSVAVELKFQPTHTGDFSTWVAVNTTAGYSIFAMSGTSSTAPIGLLQMQTLEGGTSNNKFWDFGSVYGGTVQTAVILISNTGGSPLQITKSKPPSNPELYAIYPGDEFTENQFIAPGKTGMGHVAFAPFKRSIINQNPTQYTEYWVLNTDGDGFNGPYEVAFTGTVITKQVGPLFNNGSARYKYLGCYLDGTNGRIAPNKYTFLATNENGKCQSQCASAGYAFALSEYAYECWCGNTVPDTSLKGADSLCATLCPGDTNQTCGGDGGYATAWYDSQRYDPVTNLLDGVYARPPSFMQAAGGFSFYGCWSDSASNRSLKGKATSGSNINITSCATFCQGYTWMGTSYSNECYCGNDLGGVTKPLADCNMLCAADQYSFCGAGSRLSLYLRNGTSVSSSSTTAQSSTTIGTGTTSATATPTPPISGWNYLSCWTDDVANRSLQDSNYATDDNSLTKCSQFCAGFKYFGVEYGSECYCGNVLGGASAAEGDCYKTCTGSNEICGGDNRLNVYSAKPASTKTTSTSTSSTPTPSLWVDMGCYKDYTGNRTLIGKSTTSTSNNAAWCYNYCNNLGFTYFGTEYANECYCGNAIVGVGEPVSSGCTYKCAGDQSQLCGGANRINMYMVKPPSNSSTTSSTTSTTTTSTTTTVITTSTALFTTSSATTSTTSATTSSSTTTSAPAGPTIVPSRGNFQYYACWTDRTNDRALAGWGLDPGDAMTVEKCIDFCAPTKQYVGVEDGRECWCGDSLLSGQAAVVEECSTPCTGASDEISTTTTSSIPVPTIIVSYAGFTYQGCWTDRTDDRALAGWGLDPGPEMTVEKCINFCAPTKQYVGVEDGRECWCGDSILSGVLVGDSECVSSCSGASDSVNTRTLPNKTKTDTSMTIEWCQDYCFGTLNLPYAGLESSKQCFCADKINYDRQPGQTGCTQTCAGSSMEICGGASRLSIYRNKNWNPTVIAQNVLGWKYDACWTEITGRALRGYIYTDNTGMTSAQCVTTCKSKGYALAGLENGKECHCSNANLATVVAFDADCNMNCVGNVTEYCGGSSRVQVYLSP